LYGSSDDYLGQILVPTCALFIWKRFGGNGYYLTNNDISLLVGGVDLGVAFSAHATVVKSVRDAARYLGSLPTTAACSTWAIANAKNLAVFGRLSPGDGDSALISGWQTDGGTDNNVSVSIARPHP